MKYISIHVDKYKLHWCYNILKCSHSNDKISVSSLY